MRTIQSLAGLWLLLMLSGMLAAQSEQRCEPSRWGPEDQIGAANLITPETVLQAARLIETGRTYLEERQNFANWYSFYRRRELTATAAVAGVISEAGEVQIGIYSINENSLLFECDTNRNVPRFWHSLIAHIFPQKYR